MAFRFFRRPVVMLFLKSGAVIIRSEIPVTVRVLTGRRPVEVVGGRLQLRAYRTAPAISYVYGIRMEGIQLDNVVEAPFNCARRIGAKERVEFDAALPTDTEPMGPTCKSGPVGVEYHLRAVLDLAGGDTATGPLMDTLELRNAPSLYAGAAGYRDSWDTDPTGEVEIELLAQAVAPGEPVRGTVRLRPRADLGAVEQVTVAVVRRAEFTEPMVPGLVDVKEAIEASVDLDLAGPVQPGTSEALPFELRGPPQPTCYDGVRFNLRWLVAAVVKRAGAPNTALRAELNVCSALLPPLP